MKRSTLILTGWLAMASAVLTIPWFILTFFLADRKDLATKGTEAAMLAAGTALTVYLLLALRRVIHERYAFHHADMPIALLIKVNIVTAAVTILGMALPSVESGVEVFGIIMVLILGILQITFGFRLLQLPDDLGGLHKPYCYLNIITGACLASIALIPVGMFSGAVSDVMLGTIFFQIASTKSDIR